MRVKYCRKLGYEVFVSDCHKFDCIECEEEEEL